MGVIAVLLVILFLGAGVLSAAVIWMVLTTFSVTFLLCTLLLLAENCVEIIIMLSLLATADPRTFRRVFKISRVVFALGWLSLSVAARFGEDLVTFWVAATFFVVDVWFWWRSGGDDDWRRRRRQVRNWIRSCVPRSVAITHIEAA